MSSRNVSLADLNLTINAYTTVDLLTKHYHYTMSQLINSVKSGSIYKKRDKIKVREVAPEVFKFNIPTAEETFFPDRTKSIFSVKEEYYQELDMSDEKFAEENAELADLDTKKIEFVK